MDDPVAKGSSIAPKITTIAGVAYDGILAFQHALNLVASLSPPEYSMVEDQFARLSLWSANIGVFAPDKMSMDYRLREVPDIQAVVVGLLEALQYEIKKCPDLTTLDFPPRGVTKKEAEASRSARLDDLDQIVRSVSEKISLLYKLSNTIRRASRDSQNEKAATSFKMEDQDGNDLEIVFRERFASDISELFPSIRDIPALKDRLAATMIMRRKRVLYRRHRLHKQQALAKLPSIPKLPISQPVNQPLPGRPRNVPVKAPESRLNVAPVQKTLGNVKEGLSVTKSQAQSATTLTASKFHLSSPSVVSATETIAINSHDNLKFPPPPLGYIKRKFKRLKTLRKAERSRRFDEIRENLIQQDIARNISSGKNLEDLVQEQAEKDFKASLRKDRKTCNELVEEVICPFCSCALSSKEVKDHNKWSHHVKNDLYEYVCLFETCDRPEQIYRHSTEWLKHMRQHSLQWRCNAKIHEPEIFSKREEYENHLRAKHKSTYTAAQLRLLADRNARTREEMFESCPLCGNQPEGGRMEDHIAGHLRYLALKSLPRVEDDISDTSGGSTTDGGTLEKPASRSTINEDPDRGQRPNFVDPHAETAPGIINVHDRAGNPYSQWGGFENYITLYPEGIREKWSNPEPPYHSRFFGKQPSHNSVSHNMHGSELISEDDSRWFVDSSVISGVSTNDLRLFEWGFVLADNLAVVEGADDPVLQTMEIPPEPNVFQTGLTILHIPAPGEEIVADIVIIHGLQGHPRDTWTFEADQVETSPSVPIQSKVNRSKVKFFRKSKKDAITSLPIAGPRAAVFWPFHFLPRDCPKSRILTWGYQSQIATWLKTASQTNISSHARDLLGDLDRERGSCPARPLMFVAHSLGGIILKQALIHGSRATEKSYNELVKSTKSIFFLGTPHCGGAFIELRKMLSLIARAVGADVARQNLNRLRPDDELLTMSREDFINLYSKGNFEVITFQEEHGLKPTSFAGLIEKVVPDRSSEFPNAPKRFTINANHMMMCRYATMEDDGYRKVGGELRKIYESLEAKQTEKLKRAEREKKEAEQGRLPSQAPCLRSLYFRQMEERENEVKETFSDTESWVDKHEHYLKWIEEESGILAVRGKPGSGKSTLMKRMYQLTMTSNEGDNTRTQLSFFFHRKGVKLQYSQLGMYRTLLYQLLKQIPNSGTKFWPFFEERLLFQGSPGEAWDWHLEEVREQFTTALFIASQYRKLRLFIDALDEAGDKEAHEVIDHLREIHQRSLRMQARVSICFSSRHSPILPIKEGFEICVEKNNSQDISNFILRELEDKLIFKNRQENEKKVLHILGTIVAQKASNVFMWVSVVVPWIITKWNDGGTLEQVQSSLCDVPSGLDETYEHILTKVVKQSDLEQVKLLFQLILLAEEPLSIEMLRDVWAPGESDLGLKDDDFRRTTDQVEDDGRIMSLVSSMTGGLAEISFGTVQFIHPSVNDFLFKSKLFPFFPEATGDIIGLSQDRLRELCFNRIRHGYEDRRNERLEPFLSYSVAFCFLHARKAEQSGISQVVLLEQIDWPSDIVFERWKRLYQERYLLNERYLYDSSTLLHAAAIWNIASLATRLLETGFSTEATDSSGDTAMHLGARWGSVEVVEALIAGGASMSAKNMHAETPLSVAALAGEYQIADILIQSDAGKVQQQLHEVVLAAVSSRKGREVMKMLLDRHPEKVKITEEVVQAAAENENVEIMTLLLDRSPEEVKIRERVVQAAARNNVQMMTLLLDRRPEEVKITERVLQAAAGNDVQMMTLLLDRRPEEVKITERVLQAAAGNDVQMMTLLLDRRPEEVKITERVLQAAAGNDVQMMTLLLDRRPEEVKITEKVVQAAAGNDVQMMTLLLDRRPEEVKITDKVVQAAAGNDSIEIMTLLLDRWPEEVKITEEVVMTMVRNEANGADLIKLFCENMADDVPVTREILFLAAACGQTSVLAPLENVQEPFKYDDSWFSIARFYNAAKEGDEAAITSLLQNGTSPDIKGLRGETPLWVAAYQGHLPIVRQLLETNKVDINSQSINGRVPMFEPVLVENHEIVKLFLLYGADASIPEKHGYSPLSMAILLGHYEIADMIEANLSTRKSNEL